MVKSTYPSNYYQIDNVLPNYKKLSMFPNDKLIHVLLHFNDTIRFLNPSFLVNNFEGEKKVPINGVPGVLSNKLKTWISSFLFHPISLRTKLCMPYPKRKSCVWISQIIMNVDSAVLMMRRRRRMMKMMMLTGLVILMMYHLLCFGFVVFFGHYVVTHLNKIPS